MRQIIPKKEHLNTDTFDKEKNALLDSINTQSMNEGWRYPDKFNPFPFQLSKGFVCKIKEIEKVIVKSVTHLVENYLTDSDIRKRVSLSDRVVKCIEAASERPYHIGTLRPDFIIGEKGDIEVCEINARFAVNGLILSDYMANYYQSSKGCPVKKTLVDFITNSFDKNRPIRILKGVEGGYDIHYLEKEFHKPSKGMDSKIVSPNTLVLENGVLFSEGIACDQFVLELHQSELLALPESILHHLVQKTHCMNDIRTIFIAHDKRLFSVLSDRKIMSKYLDDCDLKLLSEHIIPTFTLTDSVMERVLSCPKEWVLKKFLSGKGDGMYIGKETDCDTLKELFREHSRHYIAQKYIKQKKFHVLCKVDDHLEEVDKYLVGLMVSFDDQVLDSGFFRSSCGSIVNVSTQGGEIVGGCSE